jgi:hypothetical protein
VEREKQKLQFIANELSKLDSSLSRNIQILRDEIETVNRGTFRQHMTYEQSILIAPFVCVEVASAQTDFDRKEREYLAARTLLAKRKERKLLLVRTRLFDAV